MIQVKSKFIYTIELQPEAFILIIAITVFLTVLITKWAIKRNKSN